MYLRKLFLFLTFDVLVAFILLLILSIPATPAYYDFAIADDLENNVSNINYPYNKTFTISAYYSPIPCQSRYVTGSFDGDKRLNGNGVSGADGTPVYPGMIAAPRTYDFGTKMFIPGIGIVAVHDRGGAIVAANGNPNLHDRLDIWMGYGDKGLKRALNWGKRNVEVTVYGINNAVVEDIFLQDYTQEEKVPNCSGTPTTDVNQQIPKDIEPVKDNTYENSDTPQDVNNDLPEVIEINSEITKDLNPGEINPDVILLQEELVSLNFLKIEPSGIYDDVTKHAVMKFQQSQSLVADANSLGAGVFGPKTRDRLNEIIKTRNHTYLAIAEASPGVSMPKSRFAALSSELDFGEQNSEVKLLQVYLKHKGYFKSEVITGFFGAQTRDAVLAYQLDNKIISSPYEKGAGRVGPLTRKVINSNLGLSQI